MAIIAWDFTIKMPDAQFMLEIDTTESSGLFGKESTPRHRFTHWIARLTWPVTKHSEQMKLRGFLSRGIGGIDTFNLPLLDHRAQIGTKGGSVKFDGPHSIGDTSWTIKEGSGQLVSGDIVQPHLIPSGGIANAYRVLQGEDVLGANNISVWPPLRRDYADDDSIVKSIDASTNAYISENMRIAGQLQFPSIRPGGAATENDPNLFQPFSVEFRSAIR